MPGEAPTSTFSSLDAHNGCRGLFNGAKGWAYIGPSGAIDTKAFPDALPLAVMKGCYGEASREVAAAVAACTVKRVKSARRPGEKIIRKINEIRRKRSACLVTEDLEHLIHETKRSTAAPSQAVYVGEGDWETEGDKEGERRIRRAGRPIVLTMQAILAAASKSPKSAAPAAAAPSTTRVGEDCDQRSRFETTLSKQEGPKGEGGLNLAGRVEDQGVPQVSDPAHFPPLMLRDSSPEKTGLYLSLPIMMVKWPSSSEAGDRVKKENEAGDGGISCSEAVEATRIAEAVQAISDGANTRRLMGGMSRVGWWLRWAESAGGDAALANAMAYSAATGDGEHTNCFEASNVFGKDAWEVLPSKTELAETSEIGCHSSGATPTAGGAWALVATEKCDEARGCGGSDAGVALGSYGKDDDAESWCDCSSEVGEADVYKRSKGIEPEPASSPSELQSEREKPAVIFRSSGVFDDAKACRPAEMIEASLRSAANSKVWDVATPTDGGMDEEDALSVDGPVNQSPLSLTSPPLPPVSLSDSTEEHDLKERSVPLSYRDMLMTPSPAGATPLSKSSRLEMRDQRTGFKSSPGPSLVHCGSQASAVFRWREAAAGRGGKNGDWGLCGEEEDPYYARKRLGAFAHRTKPRGRDHK